MKARQTRVARLGAIHTLFFAIAFLVFSGLIHAQNTTEKTPDNLADVSASLETLAERVGPSVVQIFSTGYELNKNVGLLAKRDTTGSGIIVDANGYIVTNAHVVEGARRIQVSLASKVKDATGRPTLQATGTKLDARLVGMDAETDLAVLKIDGKNLPTLQFGDSERLRQGQIVLAFGAPLGLENTMTMGIVSAPSRQLGADDAIAYIQTDAPINPGNSGGPLVDVKGRVVGVNTLILTQSGGSEGLGLAIPSGVVRTVVEQLKTYGRVRRGLIGVVPQTITPTIATGLGLSVDFGVLLGDVAPDGPASNAGLEIGDVIVSMDGQKIRNVRQFVANLYRHSIDASITLETLRKMERRTVKVTVAERPDDLDRFSDMVTPEKNLVTKLGILGVDINDAIEKSLPFQMRIPSGVLVGNLSNGAADAAFDSGDIIHAVNTTPILSLNDLRRATERLRSGDSVVLQIERLGRLQFVTCEIE